MKPRQKLNQKQQQYFKTLRTLGLNASTKSVLLFAEVLGQKLLPPKGPLDINRCKISEHKSKKSSSSKMNLLHWAIMYCQDPDIVEVLLNKGSEPNILAPQGMTPLRLALDIKDEKKRQAILRLLVAKDARTDVPSIIQQPSGTDISKSDFSGQYPSLRDFVFDKGMTVEAGVLKFGTLDTKVAAVGGVFSKAKNSQLIAYAITNYGGEKEPRMVKIGGKTIGELIKIEGISLKEIHEKKIKVKFGELNVPSLFDESADTVKQKMGTNKVEIDEKLMKDGIVQVSAIGEIRKQLEEFTSKPSSPPPSPQIPPKTLQSSSLQVLSKASQSTSSSSSLAPAPSKAAATVLDANEYFRVLSGWLKSSGEVYSSPFEEFLKELEKKEKGAINRVSDGFTLLHLAIIKGDRDAVTVLLRNGADPNILSTAGKSALLLAAGNKSPQIALGIIQRLIQSPEIKSSPNCCVNYAANTTLAQDFKPSVFAEGLNMPMLYWLAQNGNGKDKYEDLACYLIEQGANFNMKVGTNMPSLLLLVVKNKWHEVAKKLIATNDQSLASSYLESYRSSAGPLCKAIENNDLEMLKILLGLPNFKTKDDNEKEDILKSALDLALRADSINPAIVKLLLTNGANPLLHPVSTDQAPADLACQKGNIDLVGFMLDSDAVTKMDPVERKKGLVNLFCEVCKLDKPDLRLVERLFGLGADPASRDAQNKSGLFYVLASKSVDKRSMVRLLLLHGAEGEKDDDSLKTLTKTNAGVERIRSCNRIFRQAKTKILAAISKQDVMSLQAIKDEKRQLEEKFQSTYKDKAQAQFMLNSAESDDAKKYRELKAKVEGVQKLLGDIEKDLEAAAKLDKDLSQQLNEKFLSENRDKGIPPCVKEIVEKYRGNLSASKLTTPDVLISSSPSVFPTTPSNCPEKPSRVGRSTTSPRSETLVPSLTASMGPSVSPPFPSPLPSTTLPADDNSLVDPSVSDIPPPPPPPLLLSSSKSDECSGANARASTDAKIPLPPLSGLTSSQSSSSTVKKWRVSVLSNDLTSSVGNGVNYCSLAMRFACKEEFLKTVGERENTLQTIDSPSFNGNREDALEQSRKVLTENYFEKADSYYTLNSIFKAETFFPHVKKEFEAWKLSKTAAELQQLDAYKPPKNGNSLANAIAGAALKPTEPKKDEVSPANALLGSLTNSRAFIAHAEANDPGADNDSDNDSDSDWDYFDDSDDDSSEKKSPKSSGEIVPVDNASKHSSDKNDEKKPDSNGERITQEEPDNAESMADELLGSDGDDDGKKKKSEDPATSSSSKSDTKGVVSDDDSFGKIVPVDNASNPSSVKGDDEKPDSTNKSHDSDDDDEKKKSKDSATSSSDSDDDDGDDKKKKSKDSATSSSDSDDDDGDDKKKKSKDSATSSSDADDDGDDKKKKSKDPTTSSSSSASLSSSSSSAMSSFASSSTSLMLSTFASPSLSLSNSSSSSASTASTPMLTQDGASSSTALSLASSATASTVSSVTSSSTASDDALAAALAPFSLADLVPTGSLDSFLPDNLSTIGVSDDDDDSFLF